MAEEKTNNQNNKNNKNSKNSINFFTKKNWTRLLMPELPIAGITLEEKAVKVLLFNRSPKEIKKVFSFPLKPGIIEEGVLKKPSELEVLLKGIRKKIWPKEKKVWIILALPSSNFYLNIFSLPEMNPKTFEEAVIFNTQMNIPLPMEAVYFDWQQIGLSNKEGEIEVLSMIGMKKNIDDYLSVFHSLQFEIVAIEPYALSFGRGLQHLSLDFSNSNFLVVDLRLEGIEFMIFDNSHLIYFDVDSWPEIFLQNIPQKISLEDIKKHLQKELPAVLNYFALKRNKKITNFFVNSFNPQFNSLLSQEIKNNYQLKESFVEVKKIYPALNNSWIAAIGAALRGLMSRSEDTIVSLAPLGTEDNYFLNYWAQIISLWSKVFITVMSVLAVSLGLADFIFFRQLEQRFSSSLSSPIDVQLQQKERELNQIINDFNSTVQDLTTVKGYQLNINEILNLVLEKCREYSVNFRRIVISGPPSKNFTFQGIINSKEEAFDFVNSLKETGKFENLNFPLTNITETQEGIAFYLNGNLK